MKEPKTYTHSDVQKLHDVIEFLQQKLVSNVKTDCRVCARYAGPTTCTSVLACVNGNQFQPGESFPLWRTE
jgi:hypothetical protein